MNDETFANLLYMSLLLAAVGGWVFVEYRSRIGQAMRVALAWGMIFLGVAAGYGLWQDLQLDPTPRQMLAEGGEIVLPRARDGHYYMTLDVGGTPVEFLVDTGATNVVLSRADADRLGLAPDGLRYLGTAQTANGTVSTARVTLADVSVGPYRDPTLRAYVNGGELDGSLLGMDYLGRFDIRISGDRMVLQR